MKTSGMIVYNSMLDALSSLVADGCSYGGHICPFMTHRVGHGGQPYKKRMYDYSHSKMMKSPLGFKHSCEEMLLVVHRLGMYACAINRTCPYTMSHPMMLVIGLLVHKENDAHQLH